MRALFEDLDFNAASQTAYVDVVEVSLPQTSARRDLYFRFQYAADGSTVDIYAYRTRAEAQTSTPPSTYAASKLTHTPSGSEATITLTNNAGEGPDLTDLAIRATLNTGVDATTKSVWCYTAAPDLVSCDNIETILKTYMDSGEALADFDSTIGIGVGPVPAVKDPVVDRPYIAIESGPVEDVSSADTSAMESHEYEITVTVYVTNMKNAQTAWRDCKGYMAAIDSILADENRTLYGECLGMFRRGAEPPAIDPEDTAEAIGSLTYAVEYQNVWRDDKVYPRS